MSCFEFFPLKYFKDDRGSVLRFINVNDKFYKNFGEKYFSWVNSGYIKGWYKHKLNTMYITSPTMNLEVLIYDEHKKEVVCFKITENNYGLIKINPGIWYALRTCTQNPCLVSVLLSDVYQENEVEKTDINTFKIHGT